MRAQTPDTRFREAGKHSFTAQVWEEPNFLRTDVPYLPPSPHRKSAPANEKWGWAQRWDAILSRVEGPTLKPTAPQPQWRRFADPGTLQPSQLEPRKEMPGEFCYPDSRMGWPGWPAPPVSGPVCAAQPETFFRDQLFPTPWIFLWNIVRLS